MFRIQDQYQYVICEVQLPRMLNKSINLNNSKLLPGMSDVIRSSGSSDHLQTMDSEFLASIREIVKEEVNKVLLGQQHIRRELLQELRMEHRATRRIINHSINLLSTYFHQYKVTYR